MNFQSTDANATLASFGPNLIPSPYRSVIIVTSISVNLELGEIPLCYIGCECLIHCRTSLIPDSSLSCAKIFGCACTEVPIRGAGSYQVERFAHRSGQSTVNHCMVHGLG